MYLLFSIHLSVIMKHPYHHSVINLTLEFNVMNDDVKMSTLEEVNDADSFNSVAFVHKKLKKTRLEK